MNSSPTPFSGNCDAWVKHVRDLTAYDQDVLEYAAGLKAQLDAIDDDQRAGAPPSPARTEQSEADLQAAGKVLVDSIIIHATCPVKIGAM
jgi:hypothetical protein